MSSSAEIYAEQLLRRCEGYPLWAPEVSEHGEVLIGDVGVVERGAFIRMFNTTRDANDEANRHGVPPEHVPFNPAAWSHRRRDNVFGGGFLCSEYVRKVTVDVSAGAQGANHKMTLGLQFECNHERGACLIVEDQGTREEVTGRRLKNYIRENMPKWYQWAVDKLDADVKLEDLMFVKGWVKTTRWTVAVFTQQARNVQFTIDAEVGAVVDAKVKFATSESQSPQYDQRTGPPERTIGRGGRRPNHGKNRPQTAYPQDQCILLHYFKLKKRWIGTKIMAAAEPKDLPPYSDDDFEVEEVPSKDEAHDPVVTLLDYILKHSDAETAIASDRDFIELCRHHNPGEFPMPHDIPAFLERVQPPLEVTEEGLGMLALDDYITAENPPAPQDDMMSIDPSADQLEKQKMTSDSSKRDHEITRNPYAQYGKPYDEIAVKKMKSGDNLLPIPNDAQRGGISSLAYSPNGRYIAAGFYGASIMIWEANTLAEKHELLGHSAPVSSLAFSPNSGDLVSGSSDSNVIIWDVETGQRRTVLEGHGGFVNTVAYSPDGRTIASASADFNVHLWDATTGFLRATTGTHDAMVMAIAFSPDSAYVASAGADCRAVIWNAANGAQSAALDGHDGMIYSISFSPDGCRIVTSSDDGTVRIWSAQSGAEFVTLREHAGSVWSAVFSPDGKQVLSVANDRTVKICDSFSGELVNNIDGNGLVNATTFSADGQLISAGTEDLNVRVWSTITGKPFANFSGHTDLVTYLRFSPDNTRLVSASNDCTVRLWQLRDVNVAVEGA